MAEQSCGKCGKRWSDALASQEPRVICPKCQRPVPRSIATANLDEVDLSEEKTVLQMPSAPVVAEEGGFNDAQTILSPSAKKPVSTGDFIAEVETLITESPVAKANPTELPPPPPPPLMRAPKEQAPPPAPPPMAAPSLAEQAPAPPPMSAPPPPPMASRSSGDDLPTQVQLEETLKATSPGAMAAPPPPPMASAPPPPAPSAPPPPFKGYADETQETRVPARAVPPGPDSGSGHRMAGPAEMTMPVQERTAATAPFGGGMASGPAATAGVVSSLPLPTEDTESPTMPTPVKSPMSGDSSKRPTMESAKGSPGKMDLTGETISGYKITKKLGAGGMGAVFLARQLSLDRDVAIKVLPSHMADNPELMARFTREALSAAQLAHHNVIQVYDVGCDQGVHYIAMEFVKGKSLRDLIKNDGKLSFDDAAAYVLQAARGLQFAHDRGIIHRDIKPDNLMLNDLGIVKVADMGLAKMTSTVDPRQGIDMNDRRLLTETGDLTMADVAMGTPAYMPPEQARDAATADHRADQYSLGCTLYYLCAGKTPYEGKTAFELITKHMKEPLRPLETLVSGVPPALSAIINRMLQKEPNDRYPSLNEVIKAIEDYLGLESDKGSYQPREQHLAALEKESKAFAIAGSVKRRAIAVPVFFGVMILCAVLSVASKQWPLAGGFVGFAVLTPLMYFILDGIQNKTFLFRRVRSVFFGMTAKGWAATVGMSLLTLIVLYMIGWLWFWIGFALFAAGTAFANQQFIVKPVKRDRSGPVMRTQEMLKSLRVRGASEEALQDFVCRFGGEHWEEFFEELFGYQEMIRLRGKWASMDDVKPRKKFGVWRDPVARWLDAIEENRKVARERAALERTERERLKATGLSEKDATKAAEAEATKILVEEVLTAKEPAKTVAQLGHKGPVRVHNIRSFKMTPNGIFRLVRLGIGLLVILAWAGANRSQLQLNIPGFLADPLASLLDAFGYGRYYYSGLVVGLALAISAILRSKFLPILIMLAAGVTLASLKIGPMIPLAEIPIVKRPPADGIFWIGVFLTGGLGLRALWVKLTRGDW